MADRNPVPRGIRVVMCALVMRASEGIAILGDGATRRLPSAKTSIRLASLGLTLLTADGLARGNNTFNISEMFEPMVNGLISVSLSPIVSMSVMNVYLIQARVSGTGDTSRPVITATNRVDVKSACRVSNSKSRYNHEKGLHFIWFENILKYISTIAKCQTSLRSNLRYYTI
jgi:hypothetical protein